MKRSFAVIPRWKYDRLQELVADGWSERKIADELEVSRDWVKDWKHETAYPAADGHAATSTEHDKKIRRENGELKKQLQEALARESKLKNIADLSEQVKNLVVTPPEWTRKPKSGAKDPAIMTAFLSDCHFDEVVFPAQVDFINEYNRQIAEKRLKNFFENTLRLTFDFITGINCEGLVMPWGGDMFSGNIHEELRVTNEAPILASILHWSNQLTAGVRMLRKEFKRIHIPCVVGNHGRLSMKPVAKNRAQDNFDWFLYHIVAREFANDTGVTFTISESADCAFSVYSTNYMLTHGDQFKGGSGIAGLLSPLMIGDARKRKRQAALRRPYDVMMMGHWHQYVHFKQIIGNGSLKGYDEYAYISNFDPEPPRQAGWLTDPIHGITLSAPIHVRDRSERYGLRHEVADYGKQIVRPANDSQRSGRAEMR